MKDSRFIHNSRCMITARVSELREMDIMLEDEITGHIIAECDSGGLYCTCFPLLQVGKRKVKVKHARNS